MDYIAQLKVELEAAVALVTTKYDPQLVRGDCSVVPSKALRRAACTVHVHTCTIITSSSGYNFHTLVPRLSGGGEQREPGWLPQFVFKQEGQQIIDFPKPARQRHPFLLKHTQQLLYGKVIN